MKKRFLIIASTVLLFFAFGLITSLSLNKSEENNVYAGEKRPMASNGTEFCCESTQSTSCGAAACSS